MKFQSGKSSSLVLIQLGYILILIYISDHRKVRKHRSAECTETVVITPEDLLGTREDWIKEGAFLLMDRVHLTKNGVKAAKDLIRKAVLYGGDHKNIPVANPYYP